MAATSAGSATLVSDKAVTIDPYTCIPKKNRKYASECTEVHLTNQNGEKLSESFAHFNNLESVWLSDNRLARVENLEANFRIREVYIENNRLVSLAGMRTFKFLRVLMASGNQLRNLEKQLAVIGRFAFLKKLDLFDNPVAEEPDYRLRLIYTVPQVEILDRRSVKGPERMKAEEVVPNLDKVSPAKPEKCRSRGPGHSKLERSCFAMDQEIRQRRKEEEEIANRIEFKQARDLVCPFEDIANGKRCENKDTEKGCRWVHVDTTKPEDAVRYRKTMEEWPAMRSLQENRSAVPRMERGHEAARLTHLEKYEIRPLIEKRAGKTDLNRDDVAALVKDLATNGVEEAQQHTREGDKLFEKTKDANPVWFTKVGRVLGDANALQPVAAEKTLGRSGSKARLSSKGSQAAVPSHPLDKIFQDPGATVSIGEVANWLLTLEWPHPDHDDNDRRIAKALEEAKVAERTGQADALEACRSTICRLARGQSYVGPHHGTGPLEQLRNNRQSGDTGLLTQLNTRQNDLSFTGLTTDKRGRLKPVDDDCTMKANSLLHPTHAAKIFRAESGKQKARGDVFTQTLIQPRRQVNEATGQMTLMVDSAFKHSTIGGKH